MLGSGVNFKLGSGLLCAGGEEEGRSQNADAYSDFWLLNSLGKSPR